jgi:hypothetical protein
MPQIPSGVLSHVMDVNRTVEIGRCDVKYESYNLLNAELGCDCFTMLRWVGNTISE